VAQLVQETIEFGNQGTLRRIGALLDDVGAPEPLLRRLEQEIRLSSSYIPWIPNRIKRGKMSKRWGVVINNG
jgi:predicted transcriptional regulator of viral defense system